MTGGRFLLLFSGGEGDAPGRWLRLRDGAVIARGEAWPQATDEERVVLVVPGTDVVCHWVDLPALAPRQALAAARLLIAEKSAEPIERVHVALGGTGDGAQLLALVSNDRMRGWLDAAAGQGIDPHHIVPAPLLLAPPEGRTWRWEQGGLHISRGPEMAFAAEPTLAAQFGAAEPIDDATVEAGLGDVLAAGPLDLRQGAFARRRRWRPDRVVVRRLAALAGASLLVTLAIPFALLLKYGLAADHMEAETRQVARAALHRDAADPPAALRARLAGLRGGGAGFTASAAALFEAVRDTANVELAALRFEADGTLRATATAATAQDIVALRQRLDARGFQVEQGETQPGGGRQIAELTMRTR
jgi:general secretion pathway protein L